MLFTNIAAYKFASIPEAGLLTLRESYRRETQALNLKGSILLSTEGINLFLAGQAENISRLKALLAEMPAFQDLHYKESLSAYQPFNRMLVKIKKEIIAFGVDTVHPEHNTAAYISPKTLKEWYEKKRPMTVLDTRNDYEIRLGCFDGAIDLGLQHFRDFPTALAKLDPALKEQPVIAYCTGGIRCEKAASFMLEQGFKEVYQLEGGILNYFEQCGGEHYQGECFVFDQRVALNAELAETNTVQCFSCRNPLTTKQQETNQQKCPYCATEGNFG